MLGILINIKLGIRLLTHCLRWTYICNPAYDTEEKEDCIPEEHPVTDLRVLQGENLNCVNQQCGLGWCMEYVGTETGQYSNGVVL